MERNPGSDCAMEIGQALSSPSTCTCRRHASCIIRAEHYGIFDHCPAVAIHLGFLKSCRRAFQTDLNLEMLAYSS